MRVIERRGLGVVRCGECYFGNSSDEDLPALYKHTWRGASVTKQDWSSQAEALGESKSEIADSTARSTGLRA